MSATPEMPRFQQQQHAFAAHIRDPENAAAPADVEARRMAVYCELFYNNIEGVLSSSFPVLRSLYGDDEWHALVRGFFSRHHAQTPYFGELPREFIHYLQHERVTQPSDPAFLLELAHYEWVEMVLSIAEEEPDFSAIDSDGDLMEGVPVLSPLAWLLSYRYPVQRIGPDYLPDKAPEQPTHIVVYRDLNDAIGFLELNPVTARLLQRMADNRTKAGIDLLLQIAAELDHPGPQAVVEGGRAIFAELQQRGVLLGIRN